MKKKIKYTKGPIGKLRAVDDFLPSPENLLFNEEKTKVTINLSTHSLNYFKGEAEKHNSSYQRMIRNLLDRYAMHYQSQ